MGNAAANPAKRPYSHFKIGIDGIVSELVDVGIRFVGDSFAVAVNIHAREARRPEGIFAEAVNPRQSFVTAFERRCLHVDRTVENRPAQFSIARRTGRVENLDAPERHEDTVLPGNPDSMSLSVRAFRVPLVGDKGYAPESGSAGMEGGHYI